MTYTYLDRTIDDRGVATITLDDPARRNALSWTMLEELADVLRGGERDPAVRAFVIRGAGDGFSTGYALDEGAGTGHEPKGRMDYAQHGVTPWNSRAHVQGHIDYWFELLWNNWKPVVAQVHGYCLAGATELVSLCDVVVVTSDTRFGCPPTRWLATGDMSAIYAWHAGLKVAKEMALGRVLSGEECERYGFANRCVAPEDLDAAVTEVTDRICAIHPELASMSKRLVNRTFDIMGLRVSCEYGGEFDSLSHLGQDYGFARATEDEPLGAALKKLNAPWGGV